VKIPTTWAKPSLSSSTNDAFRAAIDLVASPMQTIEEKLHDQGTFFEEGVQSYVAYACGSSGKRLRPLLALLAGGATGNISSEHLNLALIVELIHIASLVHDDIMDGAVVRRERPTLNAKWGNGLTVLVGDILFAHALRLATQFSDSQMSRRIADAAIGVCSGEMLQTERRFDVNLTLEHYFRIIEMKTGSLFAVACELGALLNNSSDEVTAALKIFGMKIGIAYQLLDDCIDLLGDEKNIGKTLGTDLTGGKFTLPILLLLQSASSKDQENLHHSLLNDSGVHREEVVELLFEKGTFDKAIIEINNLIDQAEAALFLIPKNDYVDGFHAMATYLRGLIPPKLSID
jgi:octaprenyl-diphosphate synthase